MHNADSSVDVALLQDNEPSLTDRAYSMLEEMIVTLKLAPGTAVSEARLSQALGIGRTPIREALQRLARERLVTILPRRGIIVSEINVKSQLRLLEVRREVERLIARSAAARDGAGTRTLRRARTYFRALREDQRRNDVHSRRREFNELCSFAARNEFGAGAMTLMHSLSDGSGSYTISRQPTCRAPRNCTPTSRKRSPRATKTARPRHSIA